MLSKSKLLKLYDEQKLSLAEIAKQVNVTPPTIFNWMDKYNIPRRTISDALCGRTLSEEHSKKIVKNLTKANAHKTKHGLKEETRKKMSIAAKARSPRKLSDETKRKISLAHLGKKMSKEARQKMSKSRKGKYTGDKHPLYGVERLDIKGENHPNWNGGTSSLYRKIRMLAKYSTWRETCFERDDFTCQTCNKRGSIELHVDHIKPFALIVKENNIKSAFEAQSCKELWNLSNGRTLCVNCHRKTNTWGAKTKKLLQGCVVNQKEL